MSTPTQVGLKGLPKKLDDFGKPQPDVALHVDLRGLSPQPKGEQEYLDRMARVAVEHERARLGQQAVEPPKEEAKVTAADLTLEEVLEQAKMKYLVEQEAKKPKIPVPSDSQLVEFYEKRIEELLAFRVHYAKVLREMADVLEST